MKILFYVALITIVSCHTSKPSSGNVVIEKNNISHLEGGWQLQMLFASDNNWVKAPVLNINLKDNTFSGNSGCNSISGKFSIKENYLGFNKNILSTKMVCADTKANQDESSFLATMLKINNYTIIKDALELSQGEIVLMKFKRN